VQWDAEILIFVDREHWEPDLDHRQYPIMPRDELIAEDHQIIEVDETRVAEHSLIGFRNRGEIGIGLPPRPIAIEMDPSILLIWWSL
jgi:hypothetical protein